jgi:PrtD family type I secretion system ABC transporter
MPVFLVVIWMMHPWVGMLAIAAATIIYLLSSVHETAVRALNKVIISNESMTKQFADTAFENSETIQALGMQNNFQGRWYGLISNALDNRDAVGFRVALVSGVSRFIRLFLQAAVLGLGAFLILEGEITAGHMVAAFILAGWAMSPLEQLVGSWNQLSQARVAYNRIQNLLLAVPVGAMDAGIPEPVGKLETRKVSFRSGIDNKVLLQNISFSLNPGEIMVLSGKSGSGKSMLCRLLVGVLEPDLGSVLLDGEDVHAWERSNFGMHVGYLPQKVELFSGSIKQNIARLSDNQSDVEVVMAAQRAGAHEMIMELAEDYDTVIGESGIELSAGQRQLVGLARAMFGNPKVLVLDEPCSNLDDEAEENFPSCLQALKNKDVTIVVVSHKPEVLECADKVLKLKAGILESLGPPEKAIIKKTGATAAKSAIAATTNTSTTTSAKKETGAGVSLPEFKNPYKPRSS